MEKADQMSGKETFDLLSNNRRKMKKILRNVPKNDMIKKIRQQEE